MRAEGPRCACSLAAVLCVICGCQFSSRWAPVSKDLLNCRQFSQQGLTSMDRGDWGKAELQFSKAVKACPTDHEARRNYAEVLWQRGARNEAVAQMIEAARLAQDDSSIRVRIAEMQLQMGHYDAARQVAQQAIASDTSQAQAWAVRARALKQSGDLRGALADCHRALALEPDNQDWLLEAAEIYRALGQPQRALAQLQTLLESYPVGEEPQQALYLTGLAHAALGRHQEAAQNLLAASQREHPSADIYFRLAEAHLRTGQLEQAEASAQAGLAVDPNHTGCHNLLDHVARTHPPRSIEATRR